MFLVFLLYALFALLFPLSKASLSYSEPFFLIGSRMTFAGLLLLSYEGIKDKSQLQLGKKSFLLLFALGFLNIYLTNIAEIWGIKHLVSAKACLLYSLSPFLAALFSYFILSESLSLKKYLGLGIGFLGLLPSFWDCWITDSGELEHGIFSFGELSILLAVVSSVLGWILLKKVLQETKVKTLVANGYSMLLGGCLAMLHSYCAGENWQPFPVMEPYLFLRNTFWMCLISNVICYNLYGYLLKSYSATFMSFAGLVTPLFASFFGWIFLGETVGQDFFLSLIFFSLGLFVFHKDELSFRQIFSRNIPQKV